jgi:Transposase domain (DUF772)
MASRGIERACREDVTYKLISAMRVPDHSTIAEFRRRHERALGELFTAFARTFVASIEITPTSTRPASSHSASTRPLLFRLGAEAREIASRDSKVVELGSGDDRLELAQQFSSTVVRADARTVPLAFVTLRSAS